MAKRWQRFSAMQRKRISFPGNGSDADSYSISSFSMVEKGYFVVYTADQDRFVVPLAYLRYEVIRQLLSMSEEEFGLPSDGPITLPCDSAFMHYYHFTNKERRSGRRSSQTVASLNSFMLFNFFFSQTK